MEIDRVKEEIHYIFPLADGLITRILSIKTGNKTLQELIEGWENGDLVEKAEDQSLPENPVKATTYLGLTEEEAYARQLESDCFTKVIQDQMLKANFVKVVGGK